MCLVIIGKKYYMHGSYFMIVISLVDWTCHVVPRYPLDRVSFFVTHVALPKQKFCVAQKPWQIHWHLMLEHWCCLLLIVTVSVYQMRETPALPWCLFTDDIWFLFSVTVYLQDCPDVSSLMMSASSSAWLCIFRTALLRGSSRSPASSSPFRSSSSVSFGGHRFSRVKTGWPLDEFVDVNWYTYCIDLHLPLNWQSSLVIVLMYMYRVDWIPTIYSTISTSTYICCVYIIYLHNIDSKEVVRRLSLRLVNKSLPRERLIL